MSDDVDTAPKTTDSSLEWNGATWLGLAGLLLAAVGVLGAVLTYSEMRGDDSDLYSTIDVWTTVLLALLVSGVGLVVVAVATVLAHLTKR